uniref:Uncharacterized protein TCIL3000_11_15730 n=1 Tax=Trypanosoma congolense (strain IL3000) TaxID=1068625 RepID=G0V340_TRYCI|nr:unnamed protein product [Trypanosoma congolense IL3000]
MTKTSSRKKTTENNADEANLWVIQRFRSVVQGLQIPAIDLSLYESCFVEPLKADPLNAKLQRALTVLCENLECHRCTTVKAVELCELRDCLVRCILKCCEIYEKSLIRGRLLKIVSHVLEPSTEEECCYFQHFRWAMEAHRSLTLQLVKAIFNWREQLSRPFAFHVSGENYIFRIIEDCELISRSALGTALRLQLSEHPLDAANMTDLCSGDDLAVPSYGFPTTSLTWKCVETENPALIDTLAGGNEKLMGLINKHKHEKPRAPSRKIAVLSVLGETIILGERALQEKLLLELQSLADRERFIPMLSIPSLIVFAESGLPLNGGAEWEKSVLLTSPPPSEACGLDTSSEPSIPKGKAKRPVVRKSGSADSATRSTTTSYSARMGCKSSGTLVSDTNSHDSQSLSSSWATITKNSSTVLSKDSVTSTTSRSSYSKTDSGGTGSLFSTFS